jgi:hypothetical protein
MTIVIFELHFGHNTQTICAELIVLSLFVSDDEF